MAAPSPRRPPSSMAYPPYGYEKEATYMDQIPHFLSATTMLLVMQLLKKLDNKIQLLCFKRRPGLMKNSFLCMVTCLAIRMKSKDKFVPGLHN
eukprot:CAMPEP_0117766286 /NCGR_PEP_ID=MMETSP0947-20121206/20753_1 /TAXON_ID=44440 /ORGANISM="Chattonella subsalsa, Strain CCMP2191" /LENGTH=92 /DNA_ID=CAMNT_0005589375 /DNA_START=18 /DNA_END=296 /DNA_ORIENTATION=-